MSRTRWNKDQILSILDSHIIDYPTPINLNYMWSFGSTAGLCLVIQIITGIFLAMHYTPHVDLAFSSVEHIMRDVNNGWLIRYLHANGASMFFIVVYCHIFRGLYYGSYINPRGHLWCSGVIIFLLMMATAFMGYVLPWGQMSFWGATVITNLFSAIPYAGGAIVEWLWGGFSVDNATLNRFFSLHYLMPFVIAGLTIVHLTLLHSVGSNNPLGINKNVDSIPFYPYFYVKDLFSFLLLVALFSFFVFYYPNALGHADNYIPANPLVTPAHIVPEWYFLPFYAILRSIPDKLGGVAAMVGAILILLALPVLNTSEIRSSKFRPIYGIFYWFLVSDFLILGWIGQKPVESPFIEIGMAGTAFYFIFFLVLLPVIGIIEKTLIRFSKDN
jgi:quinol-cytochrome oxidoreductase complex cytochrome b subunit